MPSKHVVSLLVGSCVALVACQSTPPTARDSSGTDTVAAAAGPISNYKQEVMRKAMRGLGYETGLVVVDERYARTIPGHGSARRARTQFDRAQQLLQENNWIESIGAHTRAVLMDPSQATFYNGLGKALTTKGRAREAQASFRTALQLDPQFATAQMNLADSLRGDGQIDAACDAYAAAIEMDPQLGAAHSTLAIESYYAGDYEVAWDHVHAARDLGVEVPPQFLPLLTTHMAEPVR